jgi:hypothetical protein
MKKAFFVIFALFMPILVLAQAASPTPIPAEIPVTDFFAQLLQTIKELGGVPWVGKIALIITLIISSMKVSFLNDLLWSKLGGWKAAVAPVLGLIAGLLSMAASPGGITLSGVIAYVSAGAGAIILHEIFDLLKLIPGVGPMWASVIDFIQGLLGGPKKS